MSDGNLADPRTGTEELDLTVEETDARILLIEDDDVDANLVSRFLLRRHPERVLLRVRTLREAVEVILASDLDLIVADLGLPDAQGVTAADVIVGVAPEVPLVVLTGSEDDRLANSALQLGAEDYLNKDRMNEELLNRSIRYSMTRHRTQRRLLATKEALEETDGDLDDFAHVVAHDLRSPLRTSRLLADRLMAASKNDDPAIDDLSTRLDQTLARLDDIVITMLDYASLRGQIPLVEPVDVLDLLRDVSNTISAEVEESGAVLDLRVPSGVQVLATPGLLSQVFENIVTNSLKYRSEAPPHIVVKWESDRNRVRLVFEDNGLGVPAADRERVFQVMERLQPTIPGTGFGLSICRRIIGSLDGEIWIKPECDRGTAMVVELPMPEDSRSER